MRPVQKHRTSFSEPDLLQHRPVFAIADTKVSLVGDFDRASFEAIGVPPESSGGFIPSSLGAGIIFG